MALTTVIIVHISLSIIRQGFSQHPGCIGTCYSGRLFPEPQDISQGWHLKGFSYKNITTDNPSKCYSSCTQDCRCKACQMKDARCELLDEDKTCKNDSFVKESGYVYYDLKQTMYKGESHMLPVGSCFNGCCRSQPCMNGGTCTENCHSPKQKFTCTCGEYSFGKVCENAYYPSCKAALQAGHAVKGNNIYWIKRTDNQNVFPVYCRFNRKTPMKAWTLIESFSLEKNPFKFKPFTFDFARNMMAVPSWDNYRLGRSEMLYLRAKSTIFRATCSYPEKLKTGSLKPDYLLGRLSEVDIISEVNMLGCKKYKYVNIRGYSCTECLAFTAHGTGGNWHFHLDVTWNQCDFKPPFETQNVDSFGHYTTIENNSTCTQGPQSTTQWWLGEEL